MSLSNQYQYNIVKFDFQDVRRLQIYPQRSGHLSRKWCLILCSSWRKVPGRAMHPRPVNHLPPAYKTSNSHKSVSDAENAEAHPRGADGVTGRPPDQRGYSLLPIGLQACWQVETEEEEETGKPSEAPRFVFVKKIVQDHESCTFIFKRFSHYYRSPNKLINLPHWPLHQGWLFRERQLEERG